MHNTGYGEHIARYNHFFPIFANSGIRVVGLDYQGHGATAEQSLLQLGGKNVNSIKGYLKAEDVVKQFEFVMENVVIPGAKGLPVFVVGGLN